MSNEPDDDDAPTVITASPLPPTPTPSPRRPAADRKPRAPEGPPELAPGHDLARRYRIERVIGKGGMGLVYLATDLQDGRQVALKTMPFGADPILEARFRREARLIAELAHPNIVSIVDFGQAEGLLYLAMELVEGEPLTAVLKREGALGLERAVGIARQVAEALAAAHAKDVVHRDVKPDNIMVTPAPDGTDRVKVLDFGVAKIRRAAGDAQATVQTQAGRIVGSLRYISPEQVQNGEITQRTDMYLFGCVLYELLTGRRVFDYRSPADCAVAHYMEEPKPPEVPGTKLPHALVDFVMECLQKAPEARPADARVAIAVLRGIRISGTTRGPRP